VSDDGTVIVGSGESSIDREVVRWVDGGEPESLFGTASTVSAISGDGIVVVGSINSLAYRWSEESGLTFLGALIEDGSSGASAVSFDGNAIVGKSASSEGREAYLWTATDGMIGLGDLPGGTFHGTGRDVSADGTVVVGQSNTGAGPPGHFEAFIWTADTEMLRIVDVLQWRGVDATNDWLLQVATGVSADGKTITGHGINPSGENEAWIAHIPKISADIFSVGNLLVRTGSAGIVDVDPMTGAVLGAFTQDNPNAFAFLGSHLYTTDPSDSIRVYDSLTGAFLETLVGVRRQSISDSAWPPLRDGS
jgi:uncharacterized membrane protein